MTPSIKNLSCLIFSAICATGCLHGNCTDAPGECTCFAGWDGSLCNRPLCTPTCVHGRCTESVNFNVTALQFDHTCVCDAGWTGKDCAIGLLKLCSIFTVEICLVTNRCFALSLCHFIWLDLFLCISTHKDESVISFYPNYARVRSWFFLSLAICASNCLASRAWCDIPGGCECNDQWNGTLCDQCATGFSQNECLTRSCICLFVSFWSLTIMQHPAWVAASADATFLENATVHLGTTGNSAISLYPWILTFLESVFVNLLT